MNFLHAIFGSKMKAYEKAASTLVDCANVHAYEIRTLLVKQRHHVLFNLDPKAWEMAVTVGGIYVGFMSLKHLNLGEKSEQPIRHILLSSMLAYSADAGPLLVACKQSLERRFDEFAALGRNDGNEYWEALGEWILTQVLEKDLTDERFLELKRSLGFLVVATFSNWWEAATTKS